jgi:mono/diheme cytochrome c family protein
MRKLGVLLLTAAACSSAPRLPSSPHGAPVLEVRGAVKGGPFALGRADLEALPRLSVRGEEPESRRTAAWDGTSVAALVSERVQAAKGADTVIVRTADRAAVPVPLVLIRQLKPVLADHADGARLAQPVLAWPTEQQKGLASDPRAATWWARDVVAFELVEWQRTFGPALAPPDGAADAARRGAGIYAESCISCHRMRGVGGERGPELTTVAARLGADAFTALLAKHPGWHQRPAGEHEPETASELWTFLRTVAAVAGSGPEEGPGDHRPPGEDPAADRADPVANVK